jgi:ribosomal-protein-alanine N-acetyltransferase
MVNNSSLLFRKASLADSEEILTIENKSFQHPWTKIYIEEELAQEYNLSIIMEIEKSVVAYIMSTYLLSEMHIHNLAVDPQFRNRGFAVKLLEAIPSFCPDITLAYLEVSVINHRAIELYKKFGFYEVNRRARYYEDGTDAILMTKSY